MLQTCKPFSVLIWIILVLAGSAARTQEANAEKYPPGLIVTSVDKDSPADQAGLKPGDLLLSLDGKPLRFDSQIIPTREKARWDNKKTIAITVRRGAETLSLTLNVAPLFGFNEHPPLPELSQKLYDEMLALPKEQASGRLTKLQAAVQAAGKEGDARAAAWLWFEIFRRTPGGSKEEQERLTSTLTTAESAGDVLLAATSLLNLGTIAAKRGKLDEAEDYYKRAFAIIERLAPDSLTLANSLNNLGNVALDRGKLDGAEGYYKRALAIKERLAPGSLTLAYSLLGLGTVARTRGKLEEAEGYYKRAFAIIERLAPDSLDVANSLLGLGNIASARGKLEEAEGYYKRALAIYERLAPDSLVVATSLNNLGSVAAKSDKLDEAEDYLKRSLAIRERLAPDSMDVASSLLYLGTIAWKRDRLDVAEAYYKRDLAITERLAPDSLDVATSLLNLGTIAAKRGELDEEEGYYKRAFAIYERLAPDSLTTANSLNNLGNVALDRGKLDEAQRLYQNAWQIVRKQGRQVAGDSGRQKFGQANATYAANLLMTQLKNHKPDAAFITLEEGRSQALMQVMAERGITEKVTPSEVWRPYQNAETAHNVALKDFERAASLTEQAKALLKDLEERKAGRATLELKQQEIERAEKAFETKRSEEVRTREEMESAWAAVLRANKIALPRPVDPREARKRLPSGILFLEFSVGEKELTLFIVSREQEQAFALTTPRKELEEKLAVVRQGIAGETDIRRSKPDNPGGKTNEQPITDTLRALFRQLFPPEVQAAMQKAKRIVLSPDDFLWDLPFAALVTNTGDKPNYLGLQKPLSYAQSLTLFFTPGPPGNTPETGILAIGNPLYDNARREAMSAAHPNSKAVASSSPQNSKLPVKLASSHRSGELGMMTRTGDAPDQLEYAEQEAKQVASLYHTSAHIGIEPTEAWFRQRAGQAKILHLATHGFFNPFSPQSSGILLAVPEKSPPDGQYDNDGTLQAWEVWTLKLHAELVVLSACETGRGAKVTGEGLIGLTRAWQYAGAKTIVSSQWKVSDESTSALMLSFHKHLLAGAERDEALRLAMAEVASSPKRGWSSPHQWAAFLLVGETGKMP